MMRKLGKLWLWIVYAFLFLPIFVVIAQSLEGGNSIFCIFIIT